MQTLPLILRKNGYTYVQVLRDKRSCIYEQRVDETLSYFEVFNIKIKQPQKYKSGKEYPEREVFPSNEDFGKTAWSCRTLEDAIKKFEFLKRQEVSKTER
jgi:hypothetical protein